MITSPRIRYFLGIDQGEELARAFRESSDSPLDFHVSSLTVLIAFAIGVLPILVPLVNQEAKIDIATLLIGLSAALAIAFRVHKRIPFHRGGELKRSLSLVHTGVALGCIPVVLIFVFHSESLYQIGDSLGPVSGETSGSKPTVWTVLFVIAQVSVWVAVTEEFIFRGLLISVLRRWSAIGSQRRRDLVAIGLSSLLFGLAHLHQWGPVMALGLTGLGLGFGVAYIAVREQLLPLIVYHALFDALSLSIAVFT